MGLIDRIKSALGLGTSGSAATADAGGHSGSGEVDVTVEHEPATASEDAVKGTDTASDTTASGSGGDPATTSDDDATASDDTPTDSPGDVADGTDAGTAPEVDLQDIKGIGPTYADRLREAGVESVGDLADADADALGEATDIGPNRLANWIERARAR